MRGERGDVYGEALATARANVYDQAAELVIQMGQTSETAEFFMRHAVQASVRSASLDWLHYEEKHLTPERKAQGEDAFADAFAALSPTREVWAGWGLLMSELCRRAAREHRGLDVGEWPHAMPKPVMSSTRNNEGQDTGNGCLPLA